MRGFARRVFPCVRGDQGFITAECAARQKS